MKIYIVKNFFISIFLCYFLLLTVLPSFAAEYSFYLRPQHVGIGQQAEMNLFLDTQGETINALEGEVILPSELITVDEIRYGNSIVPLWLSPPRVEENGVLSFAGMIPGGYNSSQGLIMSILFNANMAGNGIFELNSAKILKHDGLGTELPVTVTPYNITISAEPIEYVYPADRDDTPPEDFTPMVARDRTIFDNDWFVVFATQDKESGMAYYRVQESRYFQPRENKWITDVSPYRLKDQKLKSYIYIQAVDRAGNIRQVELAPQMPLAWYENYITWGILMVGLLLPLLIISMILKRIFRKK